MANHKRNAMFRQLGLIEKRFGEQPKRTSTSYWDIEG